MSPRRSAAARREVEQVECNACGQVLRRGARRATRFDLDKWRVWYQYFCPTVGDDPCHRRQQAAQRLGDRELAEAEKRTGVQAIGFE